MQGGLKKKHNIPTGKRGFTIVELLIVIVIIAILAAITIVAYNGVQKRARDSKRQSDVNVIVKALELYYADKGSFPNASNYTPGSTVINSSWSTTADGSWANLQAALQPYVSKLPTPPTSSTGAAISGGDNYDYVGFANSTYCGTTSGQGYYLTYNLDNGPQAMKTVGVCTGTAPGPYSSSVYRVIK